MSRRLRYGSVILLVLIWAGVLLSPKLRLLLTAQLQPLPMWIHQFLPPHEISLKTLATQHPNDPRILAAQIEDLSEADLSGDYRKQQLRKYDALIEEFPRQEWLIQNRLRLSMLKNLPIDISESKVDESPWLSRSEIQQALKIAERGARLNPQNSFYDWIRAISLFSLKRDKDALRALQQGADKPRFDDGVLHDMQIRDAVHALQRSQIWEERVSTTAATLMPHFAQIRKANRAAIRRGLQAERQRNDKRALEIFGVQQDLLHVMWQDSPIQLGTAIARALTLEVWNAPASGRKKPAAAPDAADDKFRDSAARFANYAQTHGREELAKSALNTAKAFENSLFSNEFDDQILGISALKVLRPIFLIQWTSAVILRGLLIVLLAWTILSVLLWRLAPRHLLPRVALLDASSSVAFIAMACIVPLASLMMFSDSQNFWDFAWPSNGELWGESNNDYLRFVVSIWPWLPLALTFLYCGVVMLWRRRRSVPFAVEDNDERVIKRAGRVLGTVTLVVATVGFALLWWRWLSSQMNNNVIEYLGLTLPFLVGWVLSVPLNQLYKRRSARDAIYGFAWSRSTLGMLIIVGSVAYFTCALFALSLRHEADSRFDDYIQRGEVTLRREAGLPF